MTRTFATLLFVFSAFVPFACSAASFTPLGDLPGDIFWSLPSAISGDGSTVVGQSYSSNGNEAFIWTRTGGMVGLGDFPGGPPVLDVSSDGFFSRASDVSFDGTVVVGVGNSAYGPEAFRWTAPGGLIGLGPNTANAPSTGVFVSGDGSVIAGNRMNGNQRVAFRWTSIQGVTALPALAGDTLQSYVRNIAADGSKIIGARWTGNTALGPGFVAPQSGARIDLGDLPGGLTYSDPLGISGDGLTIVGQSGGAKGTEAFRWTASGGIVGMGDFSTSNVQSTAYAASQDGSIIVGQGSRIGNPTAFRWTQGTGMQSVQDILVAAGINLQGWDLQYAMDVSANGNIIVGIGLNPNGDREAWLADFSPAPEPATIANAAVLIGALLTARQRRRR
jgi:uncharacterized membrane protein